MDYHRYAGALGSVPPSLLAPPPTGPPSIGSLSSSGGAVPPPPMGLPPHPALMFHYGEYLV